MNRAGLAVQDLVLQPLASAEAVLFDDERELGVVIIDIGGGTTDVALVREGAVWHTAIAAARRRPHHQRRGHRAAHADGRRRGHEEALRGRAGRAGARGRDGGRAVGGRPQAAPALAAGAGSEIIQPRVEEIFTLVARSSARAGFEDAATAGFVVTGGTSIMEGVPELAERIFDQPVRRGDPIVDGLADVTRARSMRPASASRSTASHARCRRRVRGRVERRVRWAASHAARDGIPQ